jgi:lysophospholipase L1-like esterase
MPTILFIGDSLIDQWNVECSFSEYSVRNEGLGGDTIAGTTNRLTNLLKSNKFDGIVVLIGTNDIGGKAPNGDASDSAIDEIILNRFSKLISILEITNVPYFVCPILPRNNYHKDSYLNIRAQKIDAGLQDYLQKTKNGHFVAVYNDLTDNTGNLIDYYSIDGLHLSYAGYVVLTEKVKSLLRATF